MRLFPTVLMCAALLAVVVATVGCETVKGTGRDISNFGRLISGEPIED